MKLATADPLVPSSTNYDNDDAGSDTPAAVLTSPDNDDNDDDDNEEEERDAFPASSNEPLFDPESLRIVSRGGRGGGSVATATDIATDLGSIMGMPKEAFLKSFTFFLSPVNTNEEENEDEEDAEVEEKEDKPLEFNMKESPFDINDIELSDPVVTTGRFRQKRYHLHIQAIGGLFAASRIVDGDYLKSINGKAVDGSSKEKTLRQMEQALEHDKFLSIITKSNTIHTDDILIHATILKPRTDMTFGEMGMVVWMWGFLCIKSIAKDSIFYHTALKETDHIVSVNEIMCDRVGVKGLAEIITRLPHEITITVLRRKERVTGKFG